MQLSLPGNLSRENMRTSDTCDVIAAVSSSCDLAQRGCWHRRAAFHLWGGSSAPLCGFPPMWPTLFLTGLGFCPLYHEPAAAPFSQSHCKHGNNWEKPGVLEKRRRRAQALRDYFRLPPACATTEASQRLLGVAGQGLRCPSVGYLACVGQGTAPYSFIEIPAYGLFLVLALCLSAAVEELPSQ